MTTKQTTVQQRIGRAIREAYPMPNGMAKYATFANWDLYHGPGAVGADEEPIGDGYEGWHGFQDAVRRLAEWVDANVPFSLWYDDDCGAVMDAMPEPWQDDDGTWQEPFLDATYEVSRRDAIAAYCGKELAPYVAGAS